MHQDRPHRAAGTGEPLQMRAGGLQLDGRWLWRGLDLEVPPGGTLVVHGPAGTGKSLLLRRLAALDALDEGEIRLAGTALDAWHLPTYRTRVSLVLQRPVLIADTVEEDLRLPFTLAARAGRTLDAGRAAELLGELGRPDGFAARRCRDLSGGERQVAALARALLADPQVLLLDEPTASLDEASAGRVERVLAAWLAAGPGRAAVWVSHDPAQIERVATRTLALAPAQSPAR